MIFPAFNDHMTGLPQPDVSDMISNTASARYKVANMKPYLDQRNKGWDTNIPLMRGPTITDSTNKQIPRRDAINDVIRRSKVNGGKTDLMGAYPKTGTSRKEPRGLETDGQYQPKTIMPLPDNFYPSLNSDIPVLV